MRPVPDLLPPQVATSAVATICAVFRFGSRVERATTLPPEWHPARLKLGPLDIYPSLAVVAGDNASQPPRLARITIRSNAQLWPEIMATLQARYGRPARRGQPEPGSGPVWPDNEVATWDSGDSIIEAVRRSDRFHRTTLILEHKGLAALARWRAAGGTHVQ